MVKNLSYRDKLLELVNLQEYDILLEPSAGKGSFYSLLPKNQRLGIDIDPKTKDIIYLLVKEYENFFYNMNSYNFINFKTKANLLAEN